MLHFPSPDIGMFGRRQRHVRGHRIPVTIVRPGAPQDASTAILLDTFGADDVAPLPGGCPCCTVRVALQDALRHLLADHARKPLTGIAIETGEDLGPILRTFTTERALGAAFHVEDSPPQFTDATRFVLTEDAPLEWNTFSRFMTTLTALRGADLLHVTGRLNVAGCCGPVVVQFMQHLAQRPVELQAWPDEGRASRLTFVTRDVEENAVRSLFDSIRALSTSS
jgi:G3E family GTPase